MRQHIDLAVLDLETHRTWVDELLERLKPGLEKVRVHQIKWDQGLEINSTEGPTQSSGATTRTDLFLIAQVQLRRFDALLMPVSLATLGWTRQTLAGAPRGPSIPIIGLLNDLKSGAILDLIELGMTDFVTTVACPQAFRARLISAVSRAPKALSLREPNNQIEHGRGRGRGAIRTEAVSVSDTMLSGRPSMTTKLESTMNIAKSSSRCTGCYIKVSALGWPDQGFGTSKKRLVELFEKQYLLAALKRTDGNITAAASNSQKNRRSFWELLRKHGLVSGRWSTEDESDGKGASDSEGLVTGLGEGLGEELGAGVIPRVKFLIEHEPGIKIDISKP